MSKIDNQNINNMGGYPESDEKYSPEYIVEAIVGYIPEDATIWCPFDTEESAYVKVLRSHGLEVIHSHIWNDQDFYSYEPTQHWDVLISNPPFKDKKEIFRRALDLGKPFALLGDLLWMRDEASFELFKFKGKELQILVPENRTEFLDADGNIIKSKKTGNRLPFKAIYYCSDLLPSNFETIKLDTPDENRRRGKRAKTQEREEAKKVWR